MNMMNMMKLHSGRGHFSQKICFFSSESGAKGVFEFITLHDVHKLVMRWIYSPRNTVSSLNKPAFMNIMKIYEEGLFNGFFWKQCARRAGFSRRIYEHGKAFFIMFINSVRAEAGMNGGRMDTRILFAKHWWKVCFHLYLSAHSQRTRKAKRAEMRKTAMTVLAFRAERRDE